MDTPGMPPKPIQLICATCRAEIPSVGIDIGKGHVAVRTLAPVYPLQLSDGKGTLSTVHCSEKCSIQQIEDFHNRLNG